MKKSFEYYTRNMNDYRTFFGAWSIYIFLSKYVRKGSKILNLGSFWGRDYFFLKDKGYDVINVDIADNLDLPKIKADVTKGIPVKTKTYDVVIAAEILEHVLEDAFVLKEIRRVLKPKGFLVVTIPFFNDEPEYHLRIHSPKTIRRLLEASGFDILQIAHRGGPFLSTTPYGLNLLFKLFLSVGVDIRSKVASFELFLGQTPFKKFFRISPYSGATIIAQKSKKKDFVKMNAEEFGKNY